MNHHPPSGECVVRVTYRGMLTTVELPADASVGDLGDALERATGASVATQKILGLKHANVTAGTLVPSKDAHASLAVASVVGLCGTASSKPLMLMGSAAADVAAMDAAAAVDHRVVGFDEEDRRLRRRRRHHVSRPLGASGASSSARTGGGSGGGGDGPPSTATHPHTFASYRALPVPDFISPPTAAALRLLHKLASDPGILGVMAKHKWSVPLLAEMPPEGKVGVSESCVLGYNVNAGQEIHLRLRTDDLRGFRRYARIRETLLHELTHNVWGPHDNNFKRLCSQLNVECGQFDWKRSGNGAQSLGGGGAVDESGGDESWSEDETMAATRASSGQALGGRMGGGGMSAAEGAARAAAARAADAAEREMASLARDALDEATTTTAADWSAAPSVQSGHPVAAMTAASGWLAVPSGQLYSTLAIPIPMDQSEEDHVACTCGPCISGFGLGPFSMLPPKCLLRPRWETPDPKLYS